MALVEDISYLNIGNETPLNTEIFAAVIDGDHTDFVISYFRDNITYIITQFGKIGNLYSVDTDQVQNGPVSDEPVYNLKTLLGSDNIEIEAGIRYIAGQLNIKKPLLFSLTLKKYSVDHLKLIVKCITQYKHQ